MGILQRAAENKESGWAGPEAVPGFNYGCIDNASPDCIQSEGGEMKHVFFDVIRARDYRDAVVIARNRWPNKQVSVLRLWN